MDNCTETSFRFDDYIRNAHLAAKSRKEDNKLNGVDIISDDDKVGFLGFYEGYNMIKAVFDEQWLFGLLPKIPTDDHKALIDQKEHICGTLSLASLSAAVAAATASRRAFFSCFVSGRYLGF